MCEILNMLLNMSHNFMSQGHYLLWRRTLKTLILTLKEKLGVDVADNEDAWDTLLLEDDHNYESGFEIELENN